jgi:hypothetical protein
VKNGRTFFERFGREISLQPHEQAVPLLIVNTRASMSPPEATEQVSKGSEARIRRAENRHLYTKCGYLLHPIVLIGSVF